MKKSSKKPIKKKAAPKKSSRGGETKIHYKPSREVNYGYIPIDTETSSLETQNGPPKKG